MNQIEEKMELAAQENNKFVRGNIYTYTNGEKSTPMYVLVIANERRARDKIISVLILGDSYIGHDVVRVDITDTLTKYAHCGLVTYVRNTCIGDFVKTVSPAVMSEIDLQIALELGINQTAIQDAIIYRKLYEELLAKVCKETN